MKKALSLLLSMFLIFTCASNVCALSPNEPETISSVSDNRLEPFSGNIAEEIKEKIRSGETVYYGQGTEIPLYLTKGSRSVPSNETDLTTGGNIFDFSMRPNVTYYSPWAFRATTSGRMSIFMTCGNNSPSTINLKVKRVYYATDQTLLDLDIYVSKNGTTRFVDVSAGSLYYIEASTTGTETSNVSFYVSKV